MDRPHSKYDSVESVLAHFGVKGMRWGVRKDRKAKSTTSSEPVPVELRKKAGKRMTATGGQNHPPSEDAKIAAISKQKARASTVDALSTKELQTLVARIRLEGELAKLDPVPQTTKSYITGLLKKRGSDEIDKLSRGDLSTIHQLDQLIKTTKTKVKTVK